MSRLFTWAALAAALLALAPLPAGAEMFGAEYRTCQELRRDPQVLACLAERTKFWEARLAGALRDLPKRMDRDQRAPLAEAQKAWERYRVANCGFYAARDGSIRTIHAAECKRSMTQVRAEEIALAMVEE